MKYYKYKHNMIEHYLMVSESFDVVSHGKIELVLTGIYDGMGLEIEYEKDVLNPECVFNVKYANRKHLKEISAETLLKTLSKAPNFDLNTLQLELASVPKAKRTQLQKLNISFLDQITILRHTHHY